MKKFFNYVLKKLKEPTTYAGLFTGLGVLFGIQLRPDLSDAIMSAGVGIASLILVALNEKK